MLWLLTLACTQPEPAAPPPAPLEPQKPPPVTLSLVAGGLDADGARELGLRFTIPAGWHIYWLNPGDSGLATSAELKGAGDALLQGPLWPGPERFTAPGDIVSYGYAHEVVALFRVREPAAGTTLTAAADWLACKEICVRGQGEATLTLPAPSTDLSATRALLPQPVSSWPGATLTRDEAALTLTLPEATAAELYPGLALADALGETSYQANTLRVGLKAPLAAPDGVVRVTKADGQSLYLDLATPPESP